MLSPRQAATRAGCGRSSVMRALASGHLRSIRDNSGAWLITPQALDDWLSMRRTSDRSSPDTPTGHHVDTGPDLPDRLLEAETRAAAAEAHARGLADRLADTQADRDRWRDLAEKTLAPRLIEAETQSRSTRSVVGVGFFDRLFRRG